MILYVILQAGRVSELNMQGLILEQYSYTDSLTGLPNRRAYNKTLDEIDKYEYVGVIYCDVNALKYTNDNLGHDYGDRRLLDMVAVLERHFSKDAIFRVGADEFVVIIGGITEKPFIDRCNRLYNDVVNKDRINAIGYAYGKTADVEELLHLAEKNMYEDKQNYYKKYPERKRAGEERQ